MGLALKEWIPDKHGTRPDHWASHNTSHTTYAPAKSSLQAVRQE